MKRVIVRFVALVVLVSSLSPISGVPIDTLAVTPPAQGGQSMASVAAAAAPCPLPAFGNVHFEKVWRRTDLHVSNRAVNRSWYWGDCELTGPIYEQLDNTTRVVQYFDKGRMEINDPAGDPNTQWFVTAGLLTQELITGRLQTGMTTYENRAPANIQIAGTANGPTYAIFARVSTAGTNSHPQPNRVGQYADWTMDAAGNIGVDVSKRSPRTKVVYFDDCPNTNGSIGYNVCADRNAPWMKHNIPEVFWTLMNSTGKVMVGEGVATARLSEPWYYAFGKPISDAYWSTVTLEGGSTPVLVQAFERRVLTYQPTNIAPFDVQMANIGQHYLQWRYNNQIPGRAKITASEGNGGDIYRGYFGANQPIVAANLTKPDTAAYYDDEIRVRSAGIVNAETLSTKFRLLSESRIRIKRKTTLEPLDLFFTEQGNGIYDHFNTNSEGRVVIEAGGTRIEPIDTLFSVQVRHDKSVKVSVVKGDGGVKVTPPTGPTLLVGAGKQEQVLIAREGFAQPVEALDAETVRMWNAYAGGIADPNVEKPSGVYDINKCQFKNELVSNPDRRLGCPVEPAVRNRQGDNITPGSGGGIVFYEERVGREYLGFLLYEAFSGTGYALYPGQDWDSFSHVAPPPPAEVFLNIDTLKKSQPSRTARLGKESLSCSVADWALQRYAGGTIVVLPMTGCSSSLSDPADTRFLVLYNDGTWGRTAPGAAPGAVAPPATTVPPAPRLLRVSPAESR